MTKTKIETRKKENTQVSTLGNYLPKTEHFPSIEKIIDSFQDKSFNHLTLRKKFKKINQTLCDLILSDPKPSYLLPAILDFIDRINQKNLLTEPFTLTSFEFWLNNFSDLSPLDNQEIRSKIVGKAIPRSEYQQLFPIGMDKAFTGSHFVASHLSPDVDTMTAAFWSWMDAFAARVGTGLHIWFLPGGTPDSPVTQVYEELFGKNIFSCLARNTPSLTLSAMDLVNQKNLSKEYGSQLTSHLEHGSDEKAIILINEQGQYLSDYRISDLELVNPVIISFKTCLRWFENNIHTQLISLFAKKELSKKDFPPFIISLFDLKMKDCEPVQEFSEKQKSDLNEFLIKVLTVPSGLNGSFDNLIASLEKHSINKLSIFQKEVKNLSKSSLLDRDGKLIENRPEIFHELDKVIHELDEAIQEIRNYLERLDVILAIKHQVLGVPLQYLTLRTDVEEIRQKMQGYDFLTVVIHEQDGSLFPVGVIRDSDLRKPTLGTVSLRDFCNMDEIKMASYFEVISVIDHHKMSLKTNSAPTINIGDVQSSNVILAELAFKINDKYSTGGLSQQELDSQIDEIIHKKTTTPTDNRLLQRLIQRRLALQTKGSYYIHPSREYHEYLAFLHAILDDTDLLTKVSHRDVECMAQILNRLKSLSVSKEVEVIHFDDLPKDGTFAKKAAQLLLKHPDLYSLYKKIYAYRETDVEVNLDLIHKKKPSNIFADTKEQNGCARVGQTKLFSCNIASFKKIASNMQQTWLNQALAYYEDKMDVDLHIHMVSTILSAEEVYHGNETKYNHQDELWLWIPPTQQARDHLASFLTNFQHVAKNFKDDLMHVELTGNRAEEYREIFNQNFLTIPIHKINSDRPIAVLRFKAGAVNSRKSMITPFLPRLIL